MRRHKRQSVSLVHRSCSRTHSLIVKNTFLFHRTSIKDWNDAEKISCFTYFCMDSPHGEQFTSKRCCWSGLGEWLSQS